MILNSLRLSPPALHCLIVGLCTGLRLSRLTKTASSISNLTTHRKLTMATGSGVLDAINSERRIYYQQHPHLSPKELQKGWNRHWSKISAQVTGPYETGNTVPQKRSSSKAQVGVDSLSKRPGHVGIPVLWSSFLDWLVEGLHDGFGSLIPLSSTTSIRSGRPLVHIVQTGYASPSNDYLCRSHQHPFHSATPKSFYDRHILSPIL